MAFSNFRKTECAQDIIICLKLKPAKYLIKEKDLLDSREKWVKTRFFGIL
jgi:hypothetical protein